MLTWLVLVFYIFTSGKRSPNPLAPVIEHEHASSADAAAAAAAYVAVDGERVGCLLQECVELPEEGAALNAAALVRRCENALATMSVKSHFCTTVHHEPALERTLMGVLRLPLPSVSSR